MSGDVFGNGLLREQTIRLVAAFDHRDISLTPIPTWHTALRSGSDCSICPVELAGL